MPKLQTILILVVFSFILAGCSHDKLANLTSQQNQSTSSSQQDVDINKYVQKKFDQIKSPHFVSSSPANNSITNTQVTQVVITFNFDLADNSSIRVQRDNEDIAGSQTIISQDKLSMSVPVTANQTGNYSASYIACWPDGSCHNGSFGFSIQLP